MKMSQSDASHTQDHKLDSNASFPTFVTHASLLIFSKTEGCTDKTEVLSIAV